MSDVLKSEIAEKMSLDRVRYSQVWEDHLLLEGGLDIGPDDDVLSICSAGDNALAMLLLEPRSVTAIDMNPAQTALLELKLAAIRALTHSEFVCLLGVREGHDRAALYARLRDALPESASAFWDAHQGDLLSGVVHCGRLETYFGTFVTEHASTLWPKGLADRLFAEQPLEEQAALFLNEAVTEAFEARFRWYFGREKMAEQGRDPAQFEHVEEGDVGGYFFKRFSWACTHLPLSTNFYVEHFLTSRYRDLTLAPPYLRPENFERLKGLIDRVRVVTGELEAVLFGVPQGTYSKANLSDIFEYMSDDLNAQVFEALGTQLRAGGRVAFWNLLVPRTRPASLSHLLTPLSRLSARLFEGDRSWFYRAFHVLEVTR
jgi:S-adenosylmethionine-diacylglycerol 3-amino-3-carboxypropyl transferase